jgi:hypothetical protein
MFISNISFKNPNIKYSYPRRSQYDPFYIKERNVNNNRTYPCRGYKSNYININTVNKNQEIVINLSKTNNIMDFHNGVIIQQYSIALKQNNYENFTVFKNISREETFKSWKKNDFSTKIKIPYNIKSDYIILAWSWFSNHLGNNKIEFFMNCIDLKIDNNDDIKEEF